MRHLRIAAMHHSTAV